MGELGYLSTLLEKAQEYSTTVGKMWLTMLFVFRILVVKYAVDNVWDKEQSNFLCDTSQPGCQNVCYDKTFPISHTRFWVMQIIFVSTPTLIYMGYSIHQNNKENKTNKDEQPLRDQSGTESTKKDQDKKDCTLFQIHVLCIILKIVVEVAFLIAHYFLYGFGLKPMYTCDRWPCLNTVFCYISQPTEKTIFIIFMLLMACVSLLLSMIDMYKLVIKKRKKKLRFSQMWGNGM